MKYVLALIVKMLSMTLLIARLSSMRTAMKVTTNKAKGKPPHSRGSARSVCCKPLLSLDLGEMNYPLDSLEMSIIIQA
jgi:hypothetical protein